MSRCPISLLSLCVVGLAAAVMPSGVSAQVSAEQILKYTPKQPGVGFETPSAAEAALCRVEVEKVGRTGSGYALYGPAGQTLRRFEDSDGDQKLDRYRYFQLGLEVYRDIDVNGDEKIDEFRWMNTNGTRWGVDTNGDSKIDEWKRLSAEEATREAVTALVTADPRLMNSLLLNKADARQLGLAADVASELLALSKDVNGEMQKTARAAKMTRATRWVRFDSSMLTPQLVPGESSKTSRDVIVYENVMAIIDNGGQTNFLQVGEVVRVGDVWKLTQVPRPIDANEGVIAGGVLMQPDVGPAAAAAGALSPEMQKLVDQLTALDKDLPDANASASAKVKYNQARAKLLGKLAEASSSEADKLSWIQQQVEVVTAAFQGNAYPGGIEELQSIEKTAPASLRPFIAYRRILAQYTDRLLNAKEDERASQQDWLLGQLQQYLKAYPKSSDAPEAMWQLGSALELAEKPTEAKKWYTESARNFPGTQAAELATGALRRLSMQGKPFQLAGPTLGGGKVDMSRYRGKVTAVIYWATWNADFTAALPELRKLYSQYQSNGFEILGVNADAPGAPVQAYVKEQQIKWPTIVEEQGLDSPSARQYGIFVLPHIVILNRQGVVVDESATVADLQTVVPRLLLAK